MREKEITTNKPLNIPKGWFWDGTLVRCNKCGSPYGESGLHTCRDSGYWAAQVTNKRETRDEARQRIGVALQAEIEDMRKNGLTDILLGLKVYAALVDARYELEQLKKQLGLEIKDIARYNPNSKEFIPE